MRTPQFETAPRAYANANQATAQSAPQNHTPAGQRVGGTVRGPREEGRVNVEPLSTLDAGARQGELLALMEMARRFPRDEQAVRARITQDLDEFENAAAAIYSLKISGQEKRGGSIDLARLVRRRMGNMESGFRVTKETSELVVVQGYAIDFQTGDTETQEITLEKKQKKRDGGHYYLTGQNLSLAIRGTGAKAERNCISDVVGYSLWSFACKYAERRAAAGESQKTVAERRRDMLDHASSLHVPQIALERFAGKPFEEFSFDDINLIRGAFAAISNGEATVDETFDREAKLSPSEKTAAAARTANRINERERVERVQREDAVAVNQEFKAVQKRYDALKKTLPDDGARAVSLAWRRAMDGFGVSKVSELTLDMVTQLSDVVAEFENGGGAR